jgi:hypothetical protein
MLFRSVSVSAAADEAVLVAMAAATDVIEMTVEDKVGFIRGHVA